MKSRHTLQKRNFSAVKRHNHWYLEPASKPGCIDSTRAEMGMDQIVFLTTKSPTEFARQTRIFIQPASLVYSVYGKGRLVLSASAEDLGLIAPRLFQFFKDECLRIRQTSRDKNGDTRLQSSAPSEAHWPLVCVTQFRLTAKFCAQSADSFNQRPYLKTSALGTSGLS